MTDTPEVHSVRLPLVLLVSLVSALLGAFGLVGGGAWWVSAQAAHVDALETRVTDLRTRQDARSAADEVQSKEDHATVQSIDLRLTRIEAALSILLTNRAGEAPPTFPPTGPFLGTAPRFDQK